ncbi:ATP-dependent DNA helicase [Pseudooceanicola nitratireducens]|uniref:ATP-dependent DNA helicase n=1 Tax=Pseudooceanicola nitratireducens TaxID=517719 RepID=UPI003C7EC8E0
MDWSPQQHQAISAVSKWYEEAGAPVFYLAGFAGTGKTTIARHLVEQTRASPCYAAFTGKAASVMRKSGCVDAGTLHSKIYKFKQDPATGEFRKSIDRSDASPIVKADLIVVDECSMVDEEVGKALMSFKKPILVLGDPAQLPPVKGGGYFTSGDPDVMLTEIHRQAQDNPIIQLATAVRKGDDIDFGTFGTSHVVSKEDFRAHHDISQADQVLCGLNKSRAAFNGRLRELKGFVTNMPAAGDKLVCLKNDRDLNIFNGGLFTVTEAGVFDGLICDLKVKSEDEQSAPEIGVSVRREFILGQKAPHWTELRGTQQFTYGYALTVHKAQGSQWDNVVLFDEAFGDADKRRRWLYTGITRAAQSITVVR